MSEDTEQNEPLNSVATFANIVGVAVILLLAVIVYTQLSDRFDNRSSESDIRTRSDRPISNIRAEDLQSWVSQDREHKQYSRKALGDSGIHRTRSDNLRSLRSSWRSLSPPVQRGLSAINFDTTVPAVTDHKFQLSKLGGDTVRLSDYRDEWVLVNFWATWCTPCRREMPALQALAKQLSGQPFKLVTINLKEDRSTVEQFLESESLSLTVLRDVDGDVAKAYKVRALPVSWLIDPKGNLVGRFLGPRHWNQQPVPRVFRDLVSETNT